MRNMVAGVLACFAVAPGMALAGQATGDKPPG